MATSQAAFVDEVAYCGARPFKHFVHQHCNFVAYALPNW